VIVVEYSYMAVVEQQHILNYLKKSIEKNRISHAYLFEGPDLPAGRQGRSGKKTVALWFAKCLKCQSPDITEVTVPKNKEPACRQAGKIGIKQIRELKKYLSLSPHSSPYKVAIIEEAEKMTSDAANALLKTLEEPRGNAVLILIANIASALPETILSRCEEIKFKTVSLDKISKDFIKKEHIDIIQRPLNDKFKYIEKIYKNKTEIFNLLDSWLFWFRERMMGANDGKYVKILKEIQKTKNLILNTNVNKRLALEVLILMLAET